MYMRGIIVDAIADETKTLNVPRAASCQIATGCGITDSPIPALRAASADGLIASRRD